MGQIIAPLVQLFFAWFIGERQVPGLEKSKEVWKESRLVHFGLVTVLYKALAGL